MNSFQRLKYTSLAIAALALAGCDLRKERDFEWSEETARLTGKELGTWLRKAPFTNELLQEEKNKMVLTNAAQVFPFMGRYKNTVEELQNLPDDPDNPIYRQETVLYKDPEWGDLFVNATLLYDDQEVFLDRFYSEQGNILFGSIAGAMSSYSATLTETPVSTRTGDHKAGLYWASTQAGPYLVGFYQKGKLIFETAIPLPGSDTTAVLTQLKAVNEKLGLGISQWQQATVQQLKPAETQETFWKDPFMGLYPDAKYMLDKVHLKVRNTPLEQARTVVRGDYYFSYDGPAGKTVLYTMLKETEAGREAFDTENQDLPAYEKYGQSVYYQEQQAGEQVKGVAKTFFGPDQYLEINYEYPANAPEAKAHIHGILKHVKVARFL